MKRYYSCTRGTVSSELDDDKKWRTHLATIPPQYHLYLNCVLRAARLVNSKERRPVWGIARILCLVDVMRENSATMIPIAVDYSVLSEENDAPSLAISKQLGSSKAKTAAEIMTLLEKSKEVTAAVGTASACVYD